MKISWRFVAVKPDTLPPAGARGLALDVAAVSTLPEVFHLTHHGTVGTPLEAESTTRLVVEQAHRLSGWLADPRPVQIFCHVLPDSDCFASSYLTWAFLNGCAPSGGRLWDEPGFEVFRGALANALDAIDQGRALPAITSMPDGYCNFYTLFLFLDVYLKDRTFGVVANRPSHLDEMTRRIPELLTDCEFDFKSNWQVWTAAAMSILHGLYLAEGQAAARYLELGADGVFADIREVTHRLRSFGAAAGVGWLQSLFEDLCDFVPKMVTRCVDELKDASIEFFHVKIPRASLQGEPKSVLAAWFYAPDDTGGVAAKILRGSKEPVSGEVIVVTAVAFPGQRVVISMPAGSKDYGLRGLGLALHRQNIARGCPGTKGRRYLRLVNGVVKSDPLFEHEDPWYDGRDFNYTIVDAPRDGQFRALQDSEVKEVLRGTWYQLANEYDADDYCKWLGGAEVTSP